MSKPLTTPISLPGAASSRTGPKPIAVGSEDLVHVYRSVSLGAAHGDLLAQTEIGVRLNAFCLLAVV